MAELNGQTIRQYLEPTVFPSDVTEEEFEEASKEIAARAKFLLFIAGNGPFPCPSHLHEHKTWRCFLIPFGKVEARR